MEPSVETLGGDSFSRTAKRLFLATRPMFMTASLIPVFLGTAWGVSLSGRFDLPVFLLAFLATGLVHGAVNVLNDVYDDLGGTDPCNEKRIFPFTGGSRFIQNGVISNEEMFRWGLALLGLAAFFGAALILLKGAMVLLMGLIGICLGVLYSMPPLRLSAKGLGEAAVGLGFGVLPVMGAAWLQSGRFDAGALLLSLPASLWVANILLVNEVPDREADGATGKQTLVVRFGVDFSRWLIIGVNGLAAALVVYAGIRGYLPLWSGLLPLALFGASTMALLKTAHEPGPADWLPVIKVTLATHALGSLWLIFWVLL